MGGVPGTDAPPPNMRAIPTNPSTAWSSLSGRWASIGAARERRVILLLIGVALMSAGDLSMTLTHVSGPGMMEGNPLARGIMGFNSPLALSVWKAITVALGLGILYFARRSRAGEIGAWVCCLALTWLMFRWYDYNDRVSELTPYISVLAEGGDVRWMRFSNPG